LNAPLSATSPAVAAHPQTRPGLAPLLVRAVACSAWAGVMLVLGLATLVDGPGAVPLPRLALWCFGSAAVAGGQFVFMVMVADRFFGRADRRFVIGIEAAAFSVFFGGALAALFFLTTGA